jgi:enoyl-CoA hydratase/carnithine racemase
MSVAMWRELLDVLDKFDSDPAVRCVVIRGEGGRSFCAGADIGEKQGITAEQAAADNKVTLASLRAIEDLGKPVVAMVSGYCIGAGMAIALACDLRVAAIGSSFGIPAAKLGLAYYYSEIKRLTDVVGPARAKQIIYTADRIPVERALEFGLVNEIVAADQLPLFVTAMAARIVANAPLTIAAAKHAVATALSDAQVRDIAGCDARARACLASEDYAEGRIAFREKRPPVFRGC